MFMLNKISESESESLSLSIATPDLTFWITTSDLVLPKWWSRSRSLK